MACSEKDDILQEIPDEDLNELLTLFETYKNETPQVHSFVKVAIKSKKIGMKDFVKVTSPNNVWRKDGTIFGIIKSNDLNYQVFVHTLDKSAKNLVEGLKKTKVIPLTGEGKGCIMFYCIHEDLNKAVENVLKNDKKLEFLEHGKWTTMYCMKIELALSLDPKLTIDSDVFVDSLDIRDADLINDTWPHNSEGSVDFVRDLIRLNKGFGLYLKSNHQLVSWVCISIFGQMALLYTLPEHRGKGYGNFLIQNTSKYLAEVEGIPPMGTIVVGNKSSEKLFDKARFRPLHLVNYIAVHM